ncbi:MAG: SurA N-terminal domain-containing protein [Bdellovibrionales bacterium]|nr:SurA N-terminal domain-containing protein [Bdellovibrionales bacterium]
MLELIRKYRTQFSIIFVVSAVSMVVGMFGAPGARRGQGGGFDFLSSGVAAKVDGEEIGANELAMALDRQLREMERTITAQAQKMGNTAEARKFLEQYMRSQVTPDRVLQTMIEQRFLSATADRAGMVASDATVRDMIQGIPAFRNKEGQFDPLLYKQYVAQPAVFERELATRAKVDALRAAFYAGVGVSSPAEQAENKRLTQERNFEELVLNPKDFPEPTAVDPKDVAAFVADPGSKIKLQAYYDRNIRDYQSDEQVRARHILIPETAGGLKKAQEVLAEIKSGKKTFEAAAKAYSTDKSNADRGGDLGFFGAGMMDPAFETAAFALKNKNDISEPTKSSFGYHLIQLVDRKPAVKRSFESVQAELAPKVVLEAKRNERAQAWMKGWMSAGKAPSDVELKRLKLSWKKLPAWTPMSERLGNLGGVDSRLGEILALNKNKPVLSAPLNEGESLVALRWVEGKSTAEDQKANTLLSMKVEESFQFYLQKRFETLEKNKKIVRSEKVLNKMRKSLGTEGEG